MDIRNEIKSVLIERLKADELTVDSITEMIINKLQYNVKYTPELENYLNTGIIPLLNKILNL